MTCRMFTLPASYEEIIAHKRKVLAQLQVVTPLASLRALASMQDRPQDVSSAIRETRVALLATVQNPAATQPGDEAIPYDPVALARRLVRQGAQALAVATSKHFHGGSIEHLTHVANAVRVPVIRLDYVLDEYQVVETRAAGGDGLILIASLLSRLDEDLERSLISITQRNLLTVIAQVNSAEELQAVLPYEPRVIAINNCDPLTGAVDLTLTSRLLELVPGHISVISMGGIHAPEDVAAVMTGVDGVLVPQELLLRPDTAAAIRQLLGIYMPPSALDSDPPSSTTR